MRKLKYLLISALIFGTTGCSDFLELNPISNANENGFYKTAEDMETALVSAYATLYDIWHALGPESGPVHHYIPDCPDVHHFYSPNQSVSFVKTIYVKY